MKGKNLDRLSRIVRGHLGVLLFLVGLHGCGSLLAQAQRRVDVDATRASSLMILRATGATAVQPQVRSLRLRQAELLFEQTGSTVTTVRIGDRPTGDVGRIRLEMPYRLYGVKTDGSHLDLKVMVDIAGGGLLPDGSSFAGTLHLFVLNQNNPASEEKLPQPVDFIVTGEEGAKIVPDTPSLTHTSLRHAEQLEMTVATEKDSVLTHIRPSFSASDPIDLPVPVIRPALSVTSSPEEIQGFGLEKAVIRVSVEGLMSPEKTSVALSATRGTLDNGEVTLNENGTAETSVRSGGIGQATVRAQSPVLQSGQVNLGFVMPWLFLGAAILGGVVGTVARKGVKLTVWELLVGICLGLLGAVGYAVGVNLTSVALEVKAGAAVTFFVSGIIAYAGRLAVEGVGKS